MAYIVLYSATRNLPGLGARELIKRLAGHLLRADRVFHFCQLFPGFLHDEFDLVVETEIDVILHNVLKSKHGGLIALHSKI